MSIETGCFAKTNRLNNPKDYQKVFKSSCRSADEKFLVLASRNNLTQARLGLAISKKNVSRAVSRNHIKRAVRESFRQHKKILGGMDVVVVAHKKLIVINKKKITESINAHWKTISQCRKF
ncbi:MAG: ribonuclease P protein component [Gammaproteobacteria bacterium]